MLTTDASGNVSNPCRYAGTTEKEYIDDENHFVSNPCRYAGTNHHTTRKVPPPKFRTLVGMLEPTSSTGRSRISAGFEPL